MTDTGRVVLTTARLVLREFTAHAGHVTALIRALLDADVQVAASRA